MYVCMYGIDMVCILVGMSAWYLYGMYLRIYGTVFVV